MTKHGAEVNRYFWISFSLMFLTNRLVFFVSHFLTQNRFHHNLALPVDSTYPFLPWMIIFYVGCFAFWFLMFYLISCLPREQADRFFCADLLGKTVCFLVFLLFPTAIIRPEVSGTTFWNHTVRMLYAFDAPDNIFPSVHCMVGWLCWVGVRGNREISLPWRVSAMIMAVLVCLSTLTLRQHVLVDVIAGVLLSEICWLISGIPAVRNLYSRLIDRIIHFFVSVKTRIEKQRSSHSG